jgi:hypothetical protein
MKSIYILFLGMFTALQVIATPPTIPTSNLSFPSINGASLNIAWSPGNGIRRIIIARAGAAVTAVPQNGIDYNHDNIFGAGDAILPGQFVIYDNAFTSFFLTGLTPGTEYFFAFYEYNGTGTSTEYLINPVLTGSCKTSAAPTIQASNMLFSNITGNSVNVSFTTGNGSRRIILVKEGSAVNADPVDLQSYGGNNIFGTGTQIGSGNYVLYSSSGNSTGFTNLSPGRTYHVAVYEYNGLSEPVYLKPPYRTSFTTRNVPTIPSGNITMTIIDGKELSFNWTNGNGLKRMIIMKKNTAVTALPVDGIAYTADPVFGNGTAIAPGEYVVYDGNFNSTKVSGLDPATVYHFRIYEYDGNGSNNIYLTSLFAETNASTAVKPTVPTSNIHTTNVLANAVHLQWTNGNGKGRFVIGRKNSPVNASPQDLTAYAANSSFGDGQQIGTGNFVLGYSLSTGLIVSNLEANTNYHFTVFEYNGLNQPMYIGSGSSFNVTTAGTVPVVLSAWSGKQEGSKVVLNWTTQSETNASHFEILKSVNGINFQSIQTIQATGNSQNMVQYNATDPDINSGKVYYKLAMVDKDGQTSHSAVLHFTISQTGNIIRNIINMAGSDLKFEFFPSNEITGWKIINAAGQILKQGNSNVQTLLISANQFSKGIYWIRVIRKGQVETRSFIRL